MQYTTEMILLITGIAIGILICIIIKLLTNKIKRKYWERKLYSKIERGEGIIEDNTNLDYQQDYQKDYQQDYQNPNLDYGYPTNPYQENAKGTNYY